LPAAEQNITVSEQWNTNLWHKSVSLVWRGEYLRANGWFDVFIIFIIY
jgi:hypothetical protein